MMGKIKGLGAYPLQASLSLGTMVHRPWLRLAGGGQGPRGRGCRGGKNSLWSQTHPDSPPYQLVALANLFTFLCLSLLLCKMGLTRVL